MADLFLSHEFDCLSSLLFAGMKSAAVAKAKPRPKTMYSVVSKAAGISESTFKAILWAGLGGMFLLAVLLILARF